MFTDAELKKIGLETKLFSEKELALHLEEAKKRSDSLEQYVLKQKVIGEEQLYRAAASFYQVPFIDLKQEGIRKDILFLIPEPIATTHKIVAFDKTDQELKIAALNPQDLEIFEFLRKKTGLNITISLTTPESLNEEFKNYHKGLKAEFQELTTPEQPQDTAGTGKELKELAQDLPVIRIVDTLLEYAILESASDIHIEPGEKDVIVRYRIDGILKNVMTLPKSVHPGVVARIKILSDLKLDEHRLPQDGRFKVAAPEYKVSFRVSVIPTYDGEKVVLRLLNEKTGLLSLEQLGFQTKPLEAVKRNIDKPHGMLLVTGPTGSGKTTTLYAILNILNTPEVNITTIEDPIEYRMAGLNQSQVNPKIGYTFATGLRAYLRQDPDIIMVGEIRDKETAEIAIHAALTGHLVLSTLHTNDAPSAIPRFLDLGIEGFLLASTVNVVIAQRLVRKVCRYFISQIVPKSEVTAEVAKIIKVSPGELIAKPFYSSNGCAKCNMTGYSGRVGIYEVFELDDE